MGIYRCKLMLIYSHMWKNKQTILEFFAIVPKHPAENRRIDIRIKERKEKKTPTNDGI